MQLKHHTHSPLEEGPAALAGVGVSPELASTLGPPGANRAGLVPVVTPLPPPPPLLLLLQLIPQLRHHSPDDTNHLLWDHSAALLVLASIASITAALGAIAISI